MIKTITKSAKRGVSQETASVSEWFTFRLYIYEIKSSVDIGSSTNSVRRTNRSFVLTNIITEKSRAEDKSDVSMN